MDRLVKYLNFVSILRWEICSKSSCLLFLRQTGHDFFQNACIISVITERKRINWEGTAYGTGLDATVTLSSERALLLLFFGGRCVICVTSLKHVAAMWPEGPFSHIKVSYFWMGQTEVNIASLLVALLHGGFTISFIHFILLGKYKKKTVALWTQNTANTRYVIEY